MKALLSTLFIFIMIVNVSCQQVEVMKLPGLLNKIRKNNDTVYVVNFWATWCAPCVKEIPEFERLNVLYRNQKFKLLLISLDFKKDLGKVRNFVIAKKLGTPVLLLDETKYHEWIDQIEPSWGGAIPATLILRGSDNTRKFIEKSTTFEELEAIIKPLFIN